ncbi:hypothetical protein [Actinomadura algeriensis]|uniref:Uncharacterized protein n=1 Tax=Actinomadura algeriensis TaxID=1679523 RepID=A0ABR9JT77_9ACTN|nr:hypothetical protein [Actinomadura algeriensis]MBE1533583.1 hypothetical protein [Actinomadura algeriensis]
MNAMFATWMTLGCGGALLGASAMALVADRRRPRYRGRHRADF